MSQPLRLIIFDVDGTLVDSQADILAAMGHAFAAVDLDAPDRDAILGIVGLSLPEAMLQLVPETSDAIRVQMVEGYKNAYMALRAEKGAAESSPLYPGAREVIEALYAVPEHLLAVATGKSRRGLDKLLDGHDLRRYFISQQVADDHPSKPHPSMVLTALAETGVDPHDAVMIGDTSYDMDMARAAGVRGVGVSWGYHPVHMLGADHVLERFDDLPALLENIWEVTT